MEILGLVNIPGWILGIMSFILTVLLGLNYVDYDMVKKYGKVFGCFMGNVPTLIISDADIIKQITVKEFSKFTDRFEVIKLTKRWYSAVSVATGDHWRYLRNTLSPTFTTGRLKAISPYIHKCIETLHKVLKEKIGQSPEGFDIVPFVRGYTMDVICSTGFGLEVSAQTDPDTPFIKHARAFLEFVELENPLFLLQIFFPDISTMFPWLLTSNIVPESSFNFFTDVTKKAFQERKKESSAHRDLLQLMINAHKGDIGENTADSEDQLSIEERKQRGLTEEEVVINSIMFMVDGYDTTATTLSWIIYDLVTQPGIQDKLIEEIDGEHGKDEPTYENTIELQFLDMVVNETLRFHPLLPRLNRCATEDVEINGVQIKKGMDCTFCAQALHFMPEFWDEPNKYMPERFAPENKSSINEYAYIPFGKGPRNCIGKRLALLEVKSTIITLLQKYKFYKTDELEVPMPNSKTGIVKPGKPVKVKVELR